MYAQSVEVLGRLVFTMRGDFYVTVECIGEMRWSLASVRVAPFSGGVRLSAFLSMCGASASRRMSNSRAHENREDALRPTPVPPV